MKNIIYQLLLFGVLLSLSSYLPVSKVYGSINEKPPIPAKSIAFIENSFSAALKKAKTDRKYIFVDAYTTWCGPCKQLKNTTFKDIRTADFFNKNFINLSVDMEKGEGTHLADKWRVQEYPTLLILDDNGNILLRSIGYLDAKQLLALGKKALQKK